MVLLTSPYLMFNADDTSFQKEGGLTDLVKVKYLPDDWEAKGGRPLKVAAQKDGQLVSFFIKYCMFVNAVGNIGAPIYIIADFNMEENSIDVHEVKGMEICTDLHAITYVIFCKTRSANTEFYRWFFKKVFVKFVLDCRITYSIHDSIPAYFCLDGESDQINPMREDDTIELCREYNIVIGKLPASTTSISQPLDVGKDFVGAKTINRGVTTASERSAFMEITVTERIKAMIRDHE